MTRLKIESHAGYGGISLAGAHHENVIAISRQVPAPGAYASSCSVSDYRGVRMSASRSGSHLGTDRSVVAHVQTGTPGSSLRLGVRTGEAAGDGPLS